MAQNPHSQHSAVQSNSDSFLELSKRINSIRFLLIVLIVCTHSNPMYAVFEGVRQTFDMPIVASVIITSIADVVCSVAVPLFFLISSYLLYTKETNVLDVLKKKSRTILLPYIIWCSLVILGYYFWQSFDFSKPYFTKYVIRDFDTIDWILSYIGRINHNPQPYYAPITGPVAGQMWFIRDLFILNLSFIGLKKIIDKFPVSTLFVLFILWTSCVNIYIISTEALLFFSLGYYVVKYSWNHKKLDAIQTSDIAILYITTILVQNFWIEQVPIIRNINMIIGIIVFIKLSKYLISTPKLYPALLKLNSYAFFVYATHEAIIPGIKKVGIRMLPHDSGWLILQFFAIAVITLTITLSVGFCLKKYLPKVYAVLTGGRSYS